MNTFNFFIVYVMLLSILTTNFFILIFTSHSFNFLG